MIYAAEPSKRLKKWRHYVLMYSWHTESKVRFIMSVLNYRGANIITYLRKPYNVKND